MKAEGDIRILRGVGARLLEAHLIEGELVLPLPGHRFEGRGVIAQEPQGQVIHVVATTDRIEDIGLEHGVVGDAPQRDPRPREDARVIL